jgi:radical SAM protein with 4Fe4S-binding SPASM domain
MLELRSPVACVWEITNRCNYRCPHCRAFDEKPEENDVIESKIIEQLVMAEVLSVNISGGEPLMNTRLESIVQRLTQEKIDVGISTNGYFYKEKSEMLKKAGISFVQISLDGPEGVHEEFRGVKGSFLRAVESMKCAKKNNHFVQMNTTITSKNMNYLFDNIRLAEEIGVDRIFFRRVVMAGKAKDNNQIIPQKNDYIDVIKRIIDYKYSSECKVNISIDDPIVAVLDNNRYADSALCCSAGITSLGIDSKGNIYPCIFVRNVIGNICNQSLLDIWNESEVLLNIRQRKIDKCGDCKYKWSCGGCRGASGLYMWDEMCPLE